MMRGDVLNLAGDAASRRANEERARSRRAATARLCGNADFAAFLHILLDDLGYYSRPEIERSGFGQAIQAVANHIVNDILETKEGAELMSRLARKDYENYFARVVEEISQEENETRKVEGGGR